MSMAGNYQIIMNYKLLCSFIAWLPEVKKGECYYLSLFGRKKYHYSAKNDKSPCKRIVATDKQWLLRKIRQMEIIEGRYLNKDGNPIHNKALVLYISVNPRSFALAQKLLLKKLADTIIGNLDHINPNSLALSCIQKAKSRTVYVDFDFDGVSFSEVPEIKNIINKEAYAILKTRGGFHLLVDPLKVHIDFKNSWYRELTGIKSCDIHGDNLIPVGGCCQGGFTPILLKST